jgi:hypothetical protein
VPHPVGERGVSRQHDFPDPGSRLIRIVVIEQERVNGRRSDGGRRVLPDHPKGNFVGFIRGQVRYPLRGLGLEHLEEVAPGEGTVPHFLGFRQLLEDQALETAERVRAPQLTDHRQCKQSRPHIRLTIAVQAFEEAVNHCAILSRSEYHLTKPFPVLISSPVLQSGFVM